ncbi:COMPASS component Bre2p [Monosporozyma servazzii]
MTTINTKTTHPIPMPSNPLKPGVIAYQNGDFDLKDGSKRPAFPHFTNTHDNFYKPVDIPINKRNFIYSPCSPNPEFTQLGYCTTEYPFEKPGFNVMDRSAGISFKDKSNQIVSVGKTMGWRTSRCDVCVKEGAAYWEVKVVKGGSTMHPIDDKNGVSEDNIDSSSHLRFGVSRREASLEGPVGFDSYGYGVRDQGLESIHEGKLKHVLDTSNHVLKEGDTLSFVLNLPKFDAQVNQGKEYTSRRINALRNASMKQPASSTSIEPWNTVTEEPTAKRRHKMDKNTDFQLALLEDIKYNDIVRDHIAIRYKNQLFFEATDYIKTTKPEYYSSDKRERQDYYSLENSFLSVYLNGVFVGNAFQDLNPFLPPFSELQYNEKFYAGYWRNGEYIEDQDEDNQTRNEDAENVLVHNKKTSHKKGLLLKNKYANNNKLGYYPTVSCFNGGEANIVMEKSKLKYFDTIVPPNSLIKNDIKTLDDIFMEQVADDIVWDIIDEVEEEVNAKRRGKSPTLNPTPLIKPETGHELNITS